MKLTNSTQEDAVPSADLYKLMQTMQTKLESLEQRIQDKSGERRRFANRRSSGKIECYHCSEEGHIRRNCPKLRNQQYQTNKRGQPTDGNTRRIRSKRKRKHGKNTSGNVGASNLCEEAGIYINSEVNGLKTKLLIDTGASLTLLSRKTYDRLVDKPILEESTQVITSASGSRLRQYGNGKFFIKIGQSQEIIEMMVADITVEGILGLDFLKACKGSIDFQSSSLKLNNEDCRFSWEGSLGCYRVTARNDICLPPRSEVIIQAKVPGQNAFGSADYMVEGEAKFLESGRALVGRSLVRGQDSVPVCLMNVTNNVQQIHGGTLIAQMTTVEEQNVQIGESENNVLELRSDLRELLD